MSSDKSTYTQGHNRAVTNAHKRRSAEDDAGFLLPHLKPNYRILDVGCGVASITTGLAKYVPEGNVTGIDLTDQVLAQANDTLNNMSPKPKNVTFEKGNVLDGLRFGDDTFDVIYCSQVLIHIPDPVKALEEMKRVCKPGGVVAPHESDFPWRRYPNPPGLQLWDRYLYIMIFGPTDNTHPMNPPQPPECRPGIMMPEFARLASFDPKKMKKGFGTQVMETQEETKWFADVYKDRIVNGGNKEKFMNLGASEQDIQSMLDGFDEWACHPVATIVVIQSECLFWV